MMQTATPHFEDSVGQSLARVLVRRWYALLLPLIVVPAVAFYVSVRQQHVYSASAEVLIARPELGSLLLGTALPTEDPVRRAETERSLAETYTVTAGAARKVGLPVSAVGPMIHVSLGGQADILVFSASSSRRIRAVRVANAAAAVYVALRRRLELRNVGVAHDQTASELRASTPGSQAAEQLRLRLGLLNTVAGLAGDDASVVQGARTAALVSPRPLRTAEFALAVAFVLGLALAYVVEASDRRVRSIAEIGSLLRLPVIGRIPPLRRLRSRRRLAMPVANAPSGRVAEAFRFLETNLALSPVGSECRSVIVTSARRGEGRTTVALNLALSAADAGKRVLLLELDLRNPRLKKEVAEWYAPSLTDVLSRQTSLAESVVHLPFAGAERAEAGRLDLLRAAEEVANPMPLLRSPELVDLVGAARDRYDLVIVDAPPLLGVGDATAASVLADGAVVVVDRRLARRSELNALHDSLEHLPVAPIGIVVNRTRAALEPPRASYRLREESRGLLLGSP